MRKPEENLWININSYALISIKNHPQAQQSVLSSQLPQFTVLLSRWLRPHRDVSGRVLSCESKAALIEGQREKPAMASLRQEHHYGLSCGKNNKNSSNRTLYHVKLTDTAMRALEAYQNLKVPFPPVFVCVCMCVRVPVEINPLLSKLSPELFPLIFKEFYERVLSYFSSVLFLNFSLF